uniref:protein O-GlcNAc transferase n=1 Tax=Desulfovibrio sp. U5L TaxID=596152 RepID=I2Q7Q2_9BACT
MQFENTPDPLAIRATPRQRAAYLQRLAEHFHRTQQHEKALSLLDHARTFLDGPDVELLLTRGSVLLAQGRIEESLQTYHAALEENPDDWRLLTNIAGALVAQGRAREAEPYYRKALETTVEPCRVVSNYLLSLQYRSDISDMSVIEAHKRHAAVFPYPSGSARGAEHTESGRQLRIGFVSPDFCGHPVGHFFLQLLRHMDQTRFPVFCYANNPGEDALTDTIRQHCHAWRSIRGVDDARAGALIREDGIDILIDLAGHTAGNRLPLFARRPAPVQAAWLGYPGTTGLSCLDYRLADAVTEPPAEAGKSSETVIRLPHGYHCFPAPENAPDLSPPPCAGNGRITFGSFNNVAKISPASIALWREVLASVPGSRLLLKGKAFADAPTVDRFRDAFGPQAPSVEFLPWSSDAVSHLDVYRRIDIALDTIPYNGTMTTCEALWMGVPVITLLGDRFTSRVGASLLTQAGLSEWIADDQAAYIRLAQRLAADSRKRDRLRQSLRTRLRASPLMDGKRFAAVFQSVLDGMWHKATAADQSKQIERSVLMNVITINGKEYNIDDLSDTAKKFLQSIQFLDLEVGRLKNLLAVHNTARAVYVENLKKELETSSGNNG